MSRITKGNKSPRKNLTHSCRDLSIRGIEVECSQKTGSRYEAVVNVGDVLQHAFAQHFLSMLPDQTSFIICLQHIEFKGLIKTEVATEVILRCALKDKTLRIPNSEVRIGCNKMENNSVKYKNILQDKFRMKDRQHYSDKDLGGVSGNDIITALNTSNLLINGSSRLRDNLFKESHTEKNGRFCSALIEMGDDTIQRSDAKGLYKLNEAALPLQTIFKHIPKASLADKCGVRSMLVSSFNTDQILLTEDAKQSITNHFTMLAANLKEKVLLCRDDDINSLELCAVSSQPMHFMINFHFNIYSPPVSQECTDSKHRMKWTSFSS